MLPQFNIIWFASQIFWFGISFSGFALLSFRFIVPTIIKLHKERELAVKNLIDQANKMVLESEAIKNEIEAQINLAKNEANVILNKAKKECENSNSNFNQEALKEIEFYKKEKLVNINNEIIKRRLYLLNSVAEFSSKIAAKSGIKNFVLQEKSLVKIESQLNI